MRQLSLPDGLEVFCLNADETRFVHREVFVERCYVQHGIELQEGACVFDVGANIGLSTVFFHKECPRVRIYAFEPSPDACECLKANVRHHGADARVFECGLSRSPGTADFTFYPKNTVRSGFHADPEADRASTKTYMLHTGFSPRHADMVLSTKFEKVTFACRLRTISEIIDDERIDRIDLLKIDVEKSEVEVLAGVRKEHWSRISQVVVEVDDTRGGLASVHNVLSQGGFEVKTDEDPLLKGTGLYNVFARRQ